ncbi:TrmH family RNA methyltransferase [Deinococcus lacus]|uniref:TrmH family RNA methyltransferase n=1 Tax=Deinococcus lacus TaxID=392561 RepID=A0ABW1Y9U5_9DEIO
MLITSLQNPAIKQLVRLRSRREREQAGVILVEGARELRRALAGGGEPLDIYACPELYSPEAASLAGEWPAESLTWLSRPAFEKVSGRENPDGLLAVLLTPRQDLPQPGPDALVLVLHGLEKPGNVGAILRTADGAGVTAVLVIDGDPYSPNVIRSSQGSVFTVPTRALSEAEALAWLEQHGFRCLACTPDAHDTLWEADLRGRAALFLGTEHAGLPPHLRRLDASLRIPMQGEADSLNVGVAAALVMYEALRQRR